MKYLKNITGLVLAVTMCTSMHAPILAAEEDNQVEKYNPTYEDLQDAEYYKYYDKDGYPVNNEENNDADAYNDDGEVLARAAVTSYSELGCDMSKWQGGNDGNIDWNKARAAGITFAFIKVGGRGRTDGILREDNNPNMGYSYEKQIKNAIAAGIRVGVYVYSEAINENEAIEEAQFLIDRVQQYNISLPLVIDYEGFAKDQRIGQAGLSKEQHTSIVSAFCDRVKAAGYTPMIYASASFFKTYMDGEALADKYKLWMASYSKSPDHYTDATYAFWQYTSSGNGYDIGMKSPRVDMDYWYNDGSIDEKHTPTEKAIYRLYNPVNGEHLYTTDVNEKNVLSSKHGWKYEGIGWHAPTSGTPVYRLYNPGLANHLYTTDTNEVNVLTSRDGWVKDNNGNPVFYSGGNVNILRVYNYGLKGMHHLTTDTNEYNTLPHYGWKQEGVAFKALRAK